VAFDEEVSILRPYQPPPKVTICHWDWEEGVAGFDLGQKGRGWGQDYHEVDNDGNYNGKGGKQGESINDSISEHKCIVTSNIIYSITTYLSYQLMITVAQFL
jgi:hypothetical protein